MDLKSLGWNPFFEEQFEQQAGPGRIPARVAVAQKGLYTLLYESGELEASVSGRFRHTCEARSDFPATGDWVVAEPRPQEAKATIHGLLPRRSSFSRKVKGRASEEQVVAANIDTLLIVAGLDADLNLRRIERYLTLAWQSGSEPVVVLNKADLCREVPLDRVQSVAIGVPVHVVSAVEGRGLDGLACHLERGRTASLVGSSGVGKSTLVNALLGEERQVVKEVRSSDGRGQHTTTSRQLVLLPAGGLLIDNPGMRELQLWAEEDSVKESFADIEALIAACRFSDCSHGQEPGCAVQEAMERGELDRGRYRSFLKLKQELRRLAIRKDARARRLDEQRWKRIAKAHRARTKLQRKQRHGL